ncbi:MAG: acyltransferase family protein [Candidatus Planktophila sp.]
MRIPQIQALRALAAILVLLFHAKIVGGGYIGVDIFYVISGYLITGLILREIEESGMLNFKAFYLRRVKRLLPTSFSILMVTALASWLLYPGTMRAELGKDILAAAVYVSNFLFAFWQMDYQNLNAIPPVVVHFWSLAVEEQFYLFWPIIVLIAFKFGGRKKLFQVIGAITLISFAWSLYLTQASPIWAFYSLPTRAWELGIGALLLAIPKKYKLSLFYPWAALALIIYGTLAYTDKTPFPGTAAIAPVIGTAAAIASISSWPRILNFFSNLRFTQWLGEISYPLYLWHWPLLVIPMVYLGRGLHIYERALAILATLLLADLTHRFIEQPLRHVSLSPKKIITGAVIASLIGTSTGLAISATANNTITLPTGQSYSLEEIMQKPKVYLDDCHVNNGETVSGACVYGPDVPTKVVLFGDSHAAQWMPVLEELAYEQNFQLISLTKSACPGPAVLKVETGEYKNADCSTWRDNSIARIKSIKPMAVLVSGMQYFEVPSGYASRTVWWSEGEAKTFAALQGSSKHIIYISDTPHPQRDVPSCIAAGRIDKCNNTEPSQAIFTTGWQQINPTPWFCAQNCPAILNGVVVYRDASHISVMASKMVKPQLLSTLLSLGVFASK